MGGLPAGRYRMTVMAPAHGEANREVDAPGAAADASSAAVPLAVVTFQGAGRSFGPPTASEAVTDPAGAFELRGVPSGPIQVTARHPSFAEGRASADVDPAKETPEVRITLL